MMPTYFRFANRIPRSSLFHNNICYFSGQDAHYTKRNLESLFLEEKYSEIKTYYRENTKKIHDSENAKQLELFLQTAIKDKDQVFGKELVSYLQLNPKIINDNKGLFFSVLQILEKSNDATKIVINLINSGIKLNSFKIAKIFISLKENKKYEQIKIFYFAIKSMNYKLNGFSYSLIIQIFSQANRLKEISEIIDDFFTQESNSGVPSVNYVCALIEIFASKGNFDYCFTLVSLLDDFQLENNSRIYFTLFLYLEKHEKYSEIIMIYQSMKIKDVPIDKNIFIKLIQSISQSPSVFINFLPEFFADLEKFDSPLPLPIYNKFIIILCKYNFEYVEKLINLITNTFHIQVDTFTYNILLSAYSSSSLPASRSPIPSFVRPLDEIFNLFISCGMTPDLISFNIILSHFSKLKNVSALVHFYNQLKVYSISPDHVSSHSILVGLFDANALDQLFSFFDTFKNENVPIEIPTFQLIINKLTMRNSVALVDKVIDLLPSFGYNYRQLDLSKDYRTHRWKSLVPNQ